MKYLITFEDTLESEAILLSSYLRLISPEIHNQKKEDEEPFLINDLISKLKEFKNNKFLEGRRLVLLLASTDSFKKSELFELSKVLPKETKPYIFFDALDIQFCLEDTLHFEIFENWSNLNSNFEKIKSIPKPFTNFLTTNVAKANCLSKSINQASFLALETKSISQLQENKITCITLFVNTSSQSDLTSIQSLLNKLASGLLKSTYHYKLVYYGHNSHSAINIIQTKLAQFVSLSEWLEDKSHNDEIILYAYFSTARSNLDIMIAEKLGIPIISLSLIVQDIQVSDLEWGNNEEITEQRTPTELKNVLESFELINKYRWHADLSIFSTLDSLLESYSQIKSGNIDQAKQILISLLEAYPYEKSIYIALAQANIIAKKFDDAFIWSECAQFLETKSPGTLIALGMILAKKKNIPHSRECFERAIKVAPLFEKPKKLLAALEYENSNFSKAIQLFEEVLIRHPKDKEALFGALQNYKKVANKDKVTEITKRLNEISSNS